MNRSSSTRVSILECEQKTVLSKGQKTFNRLIKQIESKRTELHNWQQALPGFQQKVASDMLPLIDTVAELQRELIRQLDRLVAMKGWKRAEREMMLQLICDIADALLERGEDEEVQTLYDKHRSAEMEQQDAEAASGFKDVLEQMFGVELGDDIDLNSPEDVLQRAREKMEEQMQREPEPKPRKKTAKQLEKEAKLKAEAEKLNQSLREIYRKLVSLLHPDREPDENERTRKTELMKRVNEAYQNNNLLQLLELQLKLEHIDQAALNNIGDERLKHYNQILKEQLLELDQELDHLRFEFEMRFPATDPRRIQPDNILQLLGTEVRKIKSQIKEMKNDLARFDDIKATRIWVREMIRQAKQLEDMDLFPF